jgi:hypothetical protein
MCFQFATIVPGTWWLCHHTTNIWVIFLILRKTWQPCKICILLLSDRNAW